jgi:hypothetical protein
MNDYFDKYIEELQKHSGSLSRLNTRTEQVISCIRLETDLINAETDCLLPIMSFIFPRRAISKFMRAVREAEAKKRGRDLVIENKVKVVG